MTRSQPGAWSFPASERAPIALPPYALRQIEALHANLYGPAAITYPNTPTPLLSG